MKGSKALFTLFLLLLAMTVAGCQGGGQSSSEPPLPMPSVAKGKKFYVVKNGSEKEFFLKGVNIGATKPGYFPGELAITKADYTLLSRTIEAILLYRQG